MPKIQPPEDFVCPITHHLMEDPVVASDGHTYERSAITQWLEKQNTSPMRIPLPHRLLVPNILVKKLIEQIINGVCTLTRFWEVIETGNVEEFQKLNFFDTHLESKKEGLTPLHYAARQNHKELTRLLLKEGAPVNARDEAGDHKGNSPLIWAACNENTEMIKILLEGGANIEHKDDAGWTPLHWAASIPKIEAMQVLLDNKANVSATNKVGDTPLHLAAKIGRVDAVKLLLAQGANYHIENADHRTPSDVAKDEKLAHLIPKYRQHLKIAKLTDQVKNLTVANEDLRVENENLKRLLLQFQSIRKSLFI
jgi:ankyrin repeat protein